MCRPNEQPNLKPTGWDYEYLNVGDPLTDVVVATLVVQGKEVRAVTSNDEMLMPLPISRNRAASLGLAHACGMGAGSNQKP